MITIKNERQILPIIQNPLSNWDKAEELFIPLINDFIESSIEYDKYDGWAFSITFIKNTHSEYEVALALMESEKAICKNGWTFAPSKENRNMCYWKANNIIVVTKKESWLWFG
ncbi:MAG: hypothetical protein J6R36_03115 [Bacteroidaceae bacterium]|nr:hypothetical protein [Bacteroidaceae bacterium]